MIVYIIYNTIYFNNKYIPTMVMEVTHTNMVNNNNHIPTMVKSHQITLRGGEAKVMC